MHSCKKPATSKKQRKQVGAKPIRRKPRPATKDESDNEGGKQGAWDYEISGETLNIVRGDFEHVLQAPKRGEQTTVVPKCVEFSADQRFLAVWWCDEVENTGDIAVYDLGTSDLETLESHNVFSMTVPAEAKQIWGVKSLSWTSNNEFRVLTTGRRGNTSLSLKLDQNQWIVAS